MFKTRRAWDSVESTGSNGVMSGVPTRFDSDCEPARLLFGPPNTIIKAQRLQRIKLRLMNQELKVEVTSSEPIPTNDAWAATVCRCNPGKSDAPISRGS